jgi:hypothetical protein
MAQPNQIFSFTIISDIEAFDVVQHGVSISAQAYSITDNQYFALEASTATVDHVSVLSVTGLGGVRWIRNFIPPVLYPRATAGGAVTDLAVTGLNGDVDGGYTIEGIINRVADGDRFYLQVNGATPSDAHCIGGILRNGTAIENPTGTDDLSLTPGSTGAYSLDGVLPFRIVIGSKSTEKQLFESTLWSDYAAVGHDGIVFYCTGAFTPAANITSIRIHAGTASHIGTGSFIKVQARGLSQ